MKRPPFGRSGLTRCVLQSDPDLTYFLHVPKTRSEEARVVVSVHGASRNVDVHVRLLSAYAEMYGAVLLVPHFPAARYDDYARLGRTGRGRRADLALHRMLAEAAALTGVCAPRCHLFGFSAGAEFAHRYAMAYPHRVAYAVLANAGKYTAPDPDRRFPRGIRPTTRVPGLQFEPEAFLRVPMKVFVGHDESVPTTPRRIRLTQLEPWEIRAGRARDWVAAMHEAARAHRVGAAVGYEELPDRIRSFRSSVLRGGLAQRAFAAMFGAPLEPRTERATPAGREPADAAIPVTGRSAG